LVTLDGQIGLLADVAYRSPLKVGRYGVILRALEDVGVAALEKALETKRFVIIDEIGPMQLYSARFQQAVLGALNSPLLVLGTLFSGSHPWLDALKQRSDLELYPLTYENREEVTQTLIKTIHTSLWEA